jgi:hypothetical protein
MTVRCEVARYRIHVANLGGARNLILRIPSGNLFPSGSVTGARPLPGTGIAETEVEWLETGCHFGIIAPALP